MVDVCVEIGITRKTLYRFVDLRADLLYDGEKLMAKKKPKE